MIQSEDFETRTKGFSLKSDGSFEAKDGVFRDVLKLMRGILKEG